MIRMIKLSISKILLTINLFRINHQLNVTKEIYASLTELEKAHVLVKAAQYILTLRSSILLKRQEEILTYPKSSSNFDCYELYWLTYPIMKSAEMDIIKATKLTQQLGITEENAFYAKAMCYNFLFWMVRVAGGIMPLFIKKSKNIQELIIMYVKEEHIDKAIKEHLATQQFYFRMYGKNDNWPVYTNEQLVVTINFIYELIWCNN